MPHVCPQCGAAYPDDETCEGRFYLSQARELEEPAYYAVHQLSVPAYMLQHDGYSRRGWIEVRALLARFVGGLTPAEVRAADRRRLDSGNRDWSITKGEKLAGVAGIAWTRTIADVRLDSAEAYCADVRAWAAVVVTDSAALIRGLGEEGNPRAGK